jgi:tetratricopeptide (TPR) repeat protein
MKSIKDLFNNALLLHQSNKLEEARVAYEEILKINPFHSNTLSLYGLILSDLNQKERALLYLKKAIKIQSKSVYYDNLGVGLKKCNRINEAIKAFEQAIIFKQDNYNVQKTDELGHQ